MTLTEKEKDLLERLAKLERPPRQPSDEVEWTEAEIRRRLDEIVEELTKAATAAGLDEKLSFEERTLYLRQGDILSAAVADLITRLPDLGDRFALLKVLGSTTLIVYEAADRLDGLIRELKRTTLASQENTKQGAALNATILAALARVTRQIHPAYPEKRQHIITRVLDETNAGSSEEDKVGRDCVRKHLTKYWNENPALAPKK
jgi:hypothetical protein